MTCTSIGSNLNVVKGLVSEFFASFPWSFDPARNTFPFELRRIEWFELVATYLVDTSFSPVAKAGTRAFFFTPSESSPFTFLPKTQS